jgi:hypothetical protein
VKRSHLNQHPKHRQFSCSSHNTEDDDTEEDKDAATAVVVLDSRPLQVNKKCVTHSLMSSGGCDGCITAVVQQEFQQSINQAQPAGKKNGAHDEVPLKGVPPSASISFVAPLYP